jgi:hypothetical protein
MMIQMNSINRIKRHAEYSDENSWTRKESIQGAASWLGAAQRNHL